MSITKIITTLFCLSLLSACSSQGERDFTRGCKSGGASSSECSCVYDKMEEHYSVDVMDTFGEQGWNMPNDFADVMVNSALQCRAEE